MDRQSLELTPATINAMHDAIGALAFAIALELPVEQRKALQSRLQRLAQSKTSHGSILAGTFLLDFALAVERSVSLDQG